MKGKLIMLALVALLFLGVAVYAETCGYSLITSATGTVYQQGYQKLCPTAINGQTVEYCIFEGQYNHFEYGAGSSVTINTVPQTYEFRYYKKVCGATCSVSCEAWSHCMDSGGVGTQIRWCTRSDCTRYSENRGCTVTTIPPYNPLSCPNECLNNVAYSGGHDAGGYCAWSTVNDCSNGGGTCQNNVLGVYCSGGGGNPTTSVTTTIPGGDLLPEGVSLNMLIGLGLVAIAVIVVAKAMGKI